MKVVEKTSVKKNLAFGLDKKKLPKSKPEMAEEIQKIDNKKLSN